MSRAYRISVSESVRKHVRVSDGICTQLEILPVLAPEGMGDLLARELAGRGFARDGEAMVRVDGDGVEIRVEVAGERAGQVTVRLSRDKELDITVEKSRRTYEEQAAGEREVLAGEVKKELARRERQEEIKLSAEVTRTLERKLKDLGRELDQIANRVTAEALKVRAGQLGEIEEISEDPETGSLTIKVRV